MTLAELRDKADAKLIQFWQALVPKQEAYFAKHGKYFQLFLSPDNVVTDGVDSDFVVKLADGVFAVDVDFAWSEKLPFSIEVHETSTPSFKAFVWVKLPNGDVYTRNREYVASDNQIDSGWSKYETGELSGNPDWIK